MARNDKQFDAVRMMRSIRDRISKEISGMSFEEEQAYIQERLLADAEAGEAGAHQDESIARSCTGRKTTSEAAKATEGEGGN